MVQSKIEIFTALLAQQPENAMIWYGLASEQYKLENWAEAATSLRQVVSLNPDYTAAYQMLGTVMAMLMTLPEQNKPGATALRLQVVPARGRPSNICKPCWRTLPANDSSVASCCCTAYRSKRATAYRPALLPQRKALVPASNE